MHMSLDSRAHIDAHRLSHRRSPRRSERSSTGESKVREACEITLVSLTAANVSMRIGTNRYVKASARDYRRGIGRMDFRGKRSLALRRVDRPYIATIPPDLGLIAARWLHRQVLAHMYSQVRNCTFRMYHADNTIVLDKAYSFTSCPMSNL